MAALFLDASGLVKYYVQEKGSGAVRLLLTHPRLTDRLFVAPHLAIEMASCFGKKYRERELRRAAYVRAVTEFEREYPDIFNVTEFTTDIVRSAVALIQADPRHRRLDAG